MKNFTPQSIFTYLVFTLLTSSILASGLEYRLKLIVPIDSVELGGLTQFSPVRKNQSNTEIGSYPNYLLAMKGMYDAEKLGYLNAEILAYFNFIEISIEEAFELENNRNEIDEKNHNILSESEMQETLDNVQNHEFYYTIQISLETERNINIFFDFPKEIDETVTTKGYFRYTFGNFFSFQDAKDALQILSEYRLEGVQIIAFDELERIPLSIAQEKEEKRLEESLANNN